MSPRRDGNRHGSRRAPPDAKAGGSPGGKKRRGGKRKPRPAGQNPSASGESDGRPRPVREGMTEGDSRPTPVRDLMDGAGEGLEAAEVPAPSRAFEADGEHWIVRVEGRTRSGTAPDRGALLLHLRFYRDEDAEHPEREAVVAGTSLDPLYDEELADILRRSRPWRPLEPPEEPRPRRQRQRGR